MVVPPSILRGHLLPPSRTSSAPKISPTPSAVDDDFYTRSSASSLLQPLFSLPRAPQPSRSTSSALVVAIAGISDTISLIITYHRLIVRSLLLPSQQQLSRFSSSVQIPLCIVSTPPKKGPQHCGPELVLAVAPGAVMPGAKAWVFCTH
ncbi:hypothetical protein GW17_00000747 [Ensete ventricosum]|nr:hypothetical protein GW17_00000747 [Ensete ventricosum]